MIRFLAILTCVLITTTSHSKPCSSVLLDQRSCSLLVGQPAPYAGTLMTDPTARALIDKAYQLEKTKLELDSLRDKAREVEKARPLLEQPGFWLVSVAALIGGFTAGYMIAK